MLLQTPHIRRQKVSSLQQKETVRVPGKSVGEVVREFL